MANIISNKFLTLLGEKAIDLENDTIKVALMLDTYTPDKDTNAFDDTYEVSDSGTGYTAGGEVLADSTVTQDDTNDKAVWDATDVEWTASTITARYAVVYDTTVSDTIIAVFDFGSNKTSDSSTFKIEWNALGIIDLAQSA